MSKMDDNDKILHCIPKERACLILTIIAILCAIGDILILLQYIATWFLMLIMPIGYSVHFGSSYDRDWIPAVFNLVIIPLVCIIDFIFAVVLCIGLRKRRPKLVKVFFIYGVVINALAFLVSIILLSCNTEELGLQGYTDPSSGTELRVLLGISVLFACVIHELFLVFVYKTYQMLLQDSRLSDRVHLVEYNSIIRELYE